MGLREGLIFQEERAAGDRCPVWVPPGRVFGKALRAFGRELPAETEVVTVGLLLPKMCVNGEAHGTDDRPTCIMARGAPTWIQG